MCSYFVEDLEKLAKNGASGGTSLDQSQRMKQVNKLLSTVEGSQPGAAFFAPIKALGNLDPAAYRTGRFDHYINLIPQASGRFALLDPSLLITIISVLLPTLLQFFVLTVSRLIMETPLGKVGGIMNRPLHEVILKSEVKFDSVQGCDEVKEQLVQIVDFLKNPSKYEKYGAKMPRGYLLTGPPGVGKTMLAKAVAGEAGVPFLSASGAEFDEIWVGLDQD